MRACEHGCIHMHACVCACMHACVRACEHGCIHVHSCMCVGGGGGTCLCTYEYTYVLLFCVYIPIAIHTHISIGWCGMHGVPLLPPCLLSFRVLPQLLPCLSPSATQPWCLSLTPLPTASRWVWLGVRCSEPRIVYFHTTLFVVYCLLF